MVELPRKSPSALLDGVVNHFDYIAGENGARLQDAAIETGQAPRARASGGFLLVNQSLHARAIDVEMTARLTQLSDFDDRLTGAEPLARAELTAVKPGDREVLAQGTGVNRKTESFDLLNGLLGDQQQGLVWPAVHLAIALDVAGEPLHRDLSLPDGVFGHAAVRNVQLENAASHVLYSGILKMMRIVVTNDDGIDAPGLASLLRVAERFGEVYVVAPAEEHSAGGHRVTVKSPIRVEQLSRTRFRVHGTPADCARLALTELVPSAAWLLAGINEGGNLGADVYMSGTVAAAREAALLGCRAVALSQYVRRSLPLDWPVAEGRAEIVLARLLASEALPGVYWNVNFPHVAGDPELVQCPLDSSAMPVKYRREGDGYVYGGSYHERPQRAGGDVEACFGGAITLTPLNL